MADTARLLVLYHSSYGHTETLAYAEAHGARAVEGVHVSVKRVPELVPEEVMRSAGMKVDQPAAATRPPSCRFTGPCSITAWSWSGCPTPRPTCPTSARSKAARPTAPAPSPRPTARVCRR